MTPDLHPTVTTDKTVEVLHDEKAEAALPGPLETRYASMSCRSTLADQSDLTRKQAIRTFWKAIIFCGIACWAGLNDGVCTVPSFRLGYLLIISSKVK